MICDPVRDLLPFVQFKKRGKHSWGSVTFSKVADKAKPTLLHRYFSRFLNYTNSIKSRKTFQIVFTYHLPSPVLLSLLNKGCVSYIFTNLFCMSKRKNLWSKEKCFLFHFESSFHSWDNQILNFQVFKCYDVIKCLSMKHEKSFI